jgi:uncharacterized delta-60 repeat protein
VDARRTLISRDLARSGWLWVCALICGLSIFAIAAPGASADPSSLDTGFGIGGTEFLHIGAAGEAQGGGIAPTADGGLVEAGWAIEASKQEIAVARYTSAGQIDEAFGSKGVVLAQLGTLGSQANAVAVLPSGDIAVAGEAESAGKKEVLVALYSATGKLEHKSEFPEGKSGTAQANAIAVNGSSELFVAGEAVEGSDKEMFVARVNASTGALESSDLIAAGEGNAVAHAIAFSGPDVVVAGETLNESVAQVVLAEVSTATKSTGFGTKIQGFDTEARGYGLTVSGGNIVVSGLVVNEANTDALVAEFSSTNGSLQSGFGTGGFAAVPIGTGENAVANAIAAESGGQLLIAGKAADVVGGIPGNEPFLARLTSAGSLDASFSPASSEQGAALLENGDSDGEYTGVYLQPNGEIVAGGSDGSSLELQEFLVARYLGPLSSGAGSGTTPTAPSAPSNPGAGGSTSSSPTTCTTSVKKFGVLEVRACFVTEGTRVIAKGEIDADGLSIVPSSCTSLVFDQQANTITSACNQGGEGEVAISLGGIPLYRGAISWEIPEDPGSLVGHLEAGAFSDLKGFPIIGQINLEAEAGGIDVVVQTELPAPFDVIHGEAKLRADLAHGLELSSIKISDEELWLGPVEVKHFLVEYQAEADEWKGGAEAELPEPLGVGIKSTVAFQHGSFEFFEADVTGLNVAVGPAVFLQEIGFAAEAKPFGLEGKIGFSIGPEIAGAKAVGLQGRFELVVPNPAWYVRVEGKASIVEVPLASGYVEIDDSGGPPNIFFGGGVNFEVDNDDCSIFCVRAGLQGWIDLSNATFDAYAHAEVGALDYTTSLGEVDVSSKAISGCLNVSLLVADISVGGAYEWGGHFHPLGDVSLGPGGASCDLSPYRPTAPKMVLGTKELSEKATEARVRWRGLQASALAAPGDQLTIPAKQRGVMWRVQGSGGVPQLTVTEPDHTQFSSDPAGTPAKGPNYLILQDKANDSAYVLVAKPAAGNWLITATGAVPISSIQASEVLPTPKLSARVTGHGRTRTLHYRLTPIAGQTVRFIEEGAGKLAHPLATVSAAKGSLHFRPVEGPGGRREITAQVLEGETVRKRLTLASFIAPPPDIGRPSKVTIRRSHSSLIVGWHAAPGGSRYRLTVHETDGAELLRVVHGTRTTLTGVPSGAGATVSVAVQTPADTTGPARTAKLTAIAVPKLRHPPAIHGTASVSATLKCTNGTWSGQPTRYVTQWLANGVTIAGATHRSLHLSSAEKGDLLSCYVTARNAEGFAAATSRAVRVTAAKRTRKG